MLLSGGSKSISKIHYTSQFGKLLTQPNIILVICGDMVRLETVRNLIMGMVYPVGSIYTNASNSANPATLLGFGTWEAFASGRVLVGKASSGTFATAGATMGAETHTLTSAESGLPAHTHGITTVKSAVLPLSTTSLPSGYNPNNTGTGTAYTHENTVSNASSAHNNIQPSIVVYMWKRTA